MELFDSDKDVLRELWQMPLERQKVQLVLYQALAHSTTLAAKDVEQVFDAITDLLEQPETTPPKRDTAL
jgi:hypothetical protein